MPYFVAAAVAAELAGSAAVRTKKHLRCCTFLCTIERDDASFLQLAQVQASRFRPLLLPSLFLAASAGGVAAGSGKAEKAVASAEAAAGTACVVVEAFVAVDPASAR